MCGWFCDLKFLIKLIICEIKNVIKITKNVKCEKKKKNNMVTCNVNSSSKMNRRKQSSNSSGFRLLDGNQCDTVSSVSRNSVYKIKIDAMFDETK